MSATRLTGLAGVASFTLIIAAPLISPPLWDGPDSTASGVEVVEFTADHRGRVIASLFVYGLGMGLFGSTTRGSRTLSGSRSSPSP